MSREGEVCLERGLAEVLEDSTSSRELQMSATFPSKRWQSHQQ